MDQLYRKENTMSVSPEFEDDNIRSIQTARIFTRNNSNVIIPTSRSMTDDIKDELKSRKYSLITLIEKHNEILIKIAQKLDELELKQDNKKKCSVM